MADDLKLDVGNRYSVVLLVFFPAYLLSVSFPQSLKSFPYGLLKLRAGGNFPAILHWSNSV